MPDPFRLNEVLPVPVWLIALFLLGFLYLLLWLATPYLMKKCSSYWPFRAPPANALLWVMVLLGAVLFILAVLGALTILGQTIWPQKPTGGGMLSTLLGRGGSMANLGAGALIVALLGAPFLIWSTVIKHNTLDTARKSLVLQDTAAFNQKINDALQGLYSRRQITRRITVRDEKKILTEWEDDIVQRNGALDRLFALARERPSEAPRIANILCVYVRELSKLSEPQSHPRQAWKDLVDPFDETEGRTDAEARAKLGLGYDEDLSSDALRIWALGLRPFRTDVEKAVQTLGMLKQIHGVVAEDVKLNLSEANLQGIDLSNLNFAKAKFSKARMEGVNLRNALMEGAILSDTRMEGANLYCIHMQSAHLISTRLDAARNWTTAILRGAMLRRVDFKATPITADQIAQTFGDASAQLPDDIPRPAHWPKSKLDYQTFQTERDKWRANPAAYTPPKP